MKLGEKKCDSKCKECPLRHLICRVLENNGYTLFEIFDKINELYEMPDKVFEAYKEILEQEVKE